jgi:hypothetical protein
MGSFGFGGVWLPHAASGQGEYGLGLAGVGRRS